MKIQIKTVRCDSYYRAEVSGLPQSMKAVRARPITHGVGATRKVAAANAKAHVLRLLCQMLDLGFEIHTEVHNLFEVHND